MDKSRQLIRLLPVALGIAALAWMFIMQPSEPKPSKAAGLASNENSIPDKKQLTVLLNSLSSAPGSDNGNVVWGERNPFDANGGGAATATGYHLSGIFWNETKPSAIINGLVVGVGSTVGLAKVKEIREDGVVLSEGNKDTVLVPKFGDQ